MIVQDRTHDIMLMAYIWNVSFESVMELLNRYCIHSTRSYDDVADIFLDAAKRGVSYGQTLEFVENQE